MRTEQVTVRHGENMGPVDWDHPTAKDKPGSGAKPRSVPTPTCSTTGG